MSIEIIGPVPFASVGAGQPRTHIGTFFPQARTLVTTPGVHATQHIDFVDRLNAKRCAAGQPPFSAEEEEHELAQGVDLIFAGRQVLIRPDPERMDLALETGELLEELVSTKRDIRFLFVMDSRVREAIKARGENWRISPLPRSPEDMQRLIAESRVGIREQPVYYHNRFTGTRYVTAAAFAQLGRLDRASLARQLQELAQYAEMRNRFGNPEVDFFAVEAGRFGAVDFRGVDFAALDETELRARFASLAERFAAAVAEDFRTDDPIHEVWRERMLRTLLTQQDQTCVEEVLDGLSPDFFLRVEWLPGGRFEEGEFFFDSLFEEAERNPGDEGLRQMCDPLVRGFIFNFIREYGDLDYINIGRVSRSLSKVRPLVRGRRGVYLVELRLRQNPRTVVRLIRLQKWGVRERLDDGKSLLTAMVESDEYTDYVLDRRLGLRQLGMVLPPSVRTRRVREVYDGPNTDAKGCSIPVTYFEREYLGGLATDKLPLSKYNQPGYAGRFATLLGRAAATNLVVGRSFGKNHQVMFDDGDEVVREDPATGLPAEIIVGDPTGSFADYQRSLLEVALDYARPVNTRGDKVPQPREFAELYLAAMREQLLHLQAEYRKRRRAFDSLFKHCHYDVNGSFAYRWECVLRRLDQTDVEALIQVVLNQMVLSRESVR